jgi:hypothetical protein
VPAGASPADLPWPPWAAEHGRGRRLRGRGRSAACAAPTREGEREREVMGRRRGEKVLRPQGVGYWGGARVLVRTRGGGGGVVARGAAW